MGLPFINRDCTMKSGTIIIINGTSSSGKTSIVHALQNLLPEPALEAGLDKFLWMMPERYLERPLWDEVLGLASVAGETGHRLVRAMHHTIGGLSKAGWNVIADHVLVEPAWVKECVGIFSEMPAYLIGVQCPLDVLEEREHSRKNRTLGQARLQYPLIHKDKVYDLEVDTFIFNPEECASQILARLDEPPLAFLQMRQML
jgi:chloramphenicol 3-O phosphotransferase